MERRRNHEEKQRKQAICLKFLALLGTARRWRLASVGVVGIVDLRRLRVVAVVVVEEDRARARGGLPRLGWARLVTRTVCDSWAVARGGWQSSKVMVARGVEARELGLAAWKEEKGKGIGLRRLGRLWGWGWAERIGLVSRLCGDYRLVKLG
ncbi:hypothetical protein Droror1_Dr00017563 [Drosera rotundifolia]